MEKLNKIEGNDYLSISVTYTKGDFRSRRGIYLHLTPVNIEDRGNGCQVRSFKLYGDLQMSGGKQLLKEMARGSKKQEGLIFKVVEEFNERLFNAWKNDDRDLVSSLINEIISTVN